MLTSQEVYYYCRKCKKDELCMESRYVDRITVQAFVCGQTVTVKL